MGISITIILVFSCKKSISGSSSSSSSIIGEWLLVSVNWTETWNGDTETETENFETDDITDAVIFEITENSIGWCENSVCGQSCDEIGIEEITNSEIIISDEEFDEDENFVMLYNLDGNSLEITMEWEGEDDGDEWSEQDIYVLEKYDGVFPPDEWNSSTPDNDNYEPDNNLQSATSINVNGASQEHLLICGEEDWYKFTASSGIDYTIETTSNLDTYIKLYDANGDYLTEDDDGGENVNAKLQFSASYNGIYYFVVHAYDYSEWDTGPYSISVRTGAGKSTTNNIIDKNKKQRMLPNFKASLKRF